MSKSTSFSTKFKQNQSFQTFLEAKAEWKKNKKLFNETLQHLRDTWSDYYEAIEVATYKKTRIDIAENARIRAEILKTEIYSLQEDFLLLEKYIKSSEVKIKEAKKKYNK